MPKYRKKPVVIDAIQLHDPETMGDPVAVHEANDALNEFLASGDLVSWEHDTPTGIILHSQRGEVMKAQPGDWIIRGVHGELYPCPAKTFADTYDPAEKEVYLDHIPGSGPIPQAARNG